MALYAGHCGGKPSHERPDKVFEDFENGYDKWKVEGDAFGREPAKGTLPNQQPVTGFAGKGLVNSFVGGDNSTGKLVSQPFTIERNYIRFLIGGGSHPTTQIRLIVDGKVVRASTGRNDERLLPEPWDVREFAGKKAHIEIVDEQKGPWGHINVDQIEFSDAAAERRDGEAVGGAAAGPLQRDPHGRRANSRRDPNSSIFDDLQLEPDAKRTTLAAGFDVVTKPLGKGQVVVAAGAILDPSQVESAAARQRAYQALCELAGATYTPPEGIPPSACGFGTLALAALADDVTVLPAFEDWNVAWEQFKAKGAFQPLDQAKANAPTAAGRTVNGAVAATVDVPAGGSVEVPFLLAWRYPNKYSAGPTSTSARP